MAVLDTPYQRLEASYTDSPLGEDDLLVHVPEGSKSLWDHIENLDLFFSTVYNLHQKNGFTSTLIGEISELLQFFFIVSFSTVLVSCVDYHVLFANKMENHSHNESNKVAVPDAFLPPGVCRHRIEAHWFLLGLLVIAGVFWIHRLIRVIYNICGYWEIYNFYTKTLGITMANLLYYTWEEIQSRIVQFQNEHQTNKKWSELDVSHRILRFKNYLVAMVNKNLLPLKHRLPLLGDTVFYPNSLKYNFQLLFFWGYGCFFQDGWRLKPEYKRKEKRLELAEKLSRHILWIGLANLVLCPLVLIWEILHVFFKYTEVLHRNPGSLGVRQWSLYGRYYVRHFNEMDHQLQARLNRAYKPACRYMSCFYSPLLAVVAKHIGFLAGSVLAVLMALVVYDEDVLAVAHVLSAITLLGVVVMVCRSFIPDQHLVFCPKQLMKEILAHIHYMPDRWQEKANWEETRREFAQLFQYKAVFVLEALLSPLLTPLVLIFQLRPKSLEIIDFFRESTVEVVGVGDICSFAQLDVRRPGDPARMSARGSDYQSATVGKTETSINQPAEDRKTELSRIHFAITNPSWRPEFLEHLRKQIQQDGETVTPTPPSGLGDPRDGSRLSMQSESEPRSLKMNTSPAGLPAHVSDLSEVASAVLSRSFSMNPILSSRVGFGSSLWDGPVTRSEYAAMEMSLHALYMHELHQQNTRAPLVHLPQDQVSGIGLVTSDVPASAGSPSLSTVLLEERMPSTGAHRFSARTDYGSLQSAPSSTARPLMGETSADSQSSRHPEPAPEEGPEDALPPPHTQV
ncbi:autophagy-related protein 9A-like isoform 1-T3 [Anomaloglossus baeobatrachus]|uniref:autophagy-related protein 9A-like isoform X1 n=1 Tax=Anomaloglossus baeobatrachus TaxID=238106 RepID=UPI003F4FCD3A